MKKMLLLVVSVITFIAANAAEWGYAPQEKSVAVNFKNKADHYNFMAFGTPFPIPAQNLYRTANGSPMPKEWYTTRASKMGKVNLDSWTALLNAFPAEYRQQLLFPKSYTDSLIISTEPKGHLIKIIKIEDTYYIEQKSRTTKDTIWIIK